MTADSVTSRIRSTKCLYNLVIKKSAKINLKKHDCLELKGAYPQNRKIIIEIFLKYDIHSVQHMLNLLCKLLKINDQD